VRIKPLIIPGIALLVGVAIGIGVMVAAMVKGPNQVITMMAQGDTEEQAIYGTLLNEKRYGDLQRLIESGLLTSLNFQKGMNLSANDYRASQQFVRGYFDCTGRPIPAAIAQQIQAIPKGSGTGMRRLADAAVISSADLSSALR